MAIYVDDLRRWGWRLRGRETPSCHLFTDSLDLEDLHRFAEQLGMRRAWFQPHRVAPHYDLTPARRQAALAIGAIEVDRRTACAIWRGRRLLLWREAELHDFEFASQRRIRWDG